jgi:hypothetical protein
MNTRTGRIYRSPTRSRLGPDALRTEQLNDPDIGPILQEVEAGQRPDC